VLSIHKRYCRALGLNRSCDLASPAYTNFPSVRSCGFRHTVIESFKLAKILKTIKSKLNVILQNPPLNHDPKRHIYMSFKYLQGW